MKDKLLKRMQNQENFKDLYINTVKFKEEKKNSEQDYLLEKTMGEKFEKEKNDQEKAFQYRNQV